MFKLFTAVVLSFTLLSLDVPWSNIHNVVVKKKLLLETSFSFCISFSRWQYLIFLSFFLFFLCYCRSCNSQTISLTLKYQSPVCTDISNSFKSHRYCPTQSRHHSTMSWKSSIFVFNFHGIFVGFYCRCLDHFCPRVDMCIPASLPILSRFLKAIDLVSTIRWHSRVEERGVLPIF